MLWRCCGFFDSRQIVHFFLIPVSLETKKMCFLSSNMHWENSRQCWENTTVSTVNNQRRDFLPNTAIHLMSLFGQIFSCLSLLERHYSGMLECLWSDVNSLLVHRVILFLPTNVLMHILIIQFSMDIIHLFEPMKSLDELCYHISFWNWNFGCGVSCHSHAPCHFFIRILSDIKGRVILFVYVWKMYIYKS